MTDDYPDDGDDAPDDGDDRWGNRLPDDADSGSGSWLSNLLSALDRLEEFSKSGRRTGSRGFDYDVSIRSGLDDLGLDRGTEDREGFATANRDDGSRGGREGFSAPGRSGSSGRRTRYRRSAASDHHVTTRTHEDELIVTADLGGVDPEDVTVGFDGATLVIGADGHELERVRIPWEETEAEAAVKNEILTVSVRPEGDPP